MIDPTGEGGVEGLGNLDGGGRQARLSLGSSQRHRRIA